MNQDNRKIKVLWIYHRADTFAGSYLSILEILRRVDRSRFEIAAVLPGAGSCGADLEAAGVRVTYRPTLASEKTIRYLKAAWSFRHLLRRDRVDVVYFADYVTWRPSELVGARLARTPVVAHFRSPVSDAFAADSWLRAVTAIVGNSTATLQAFRGRVAEEALHVVYNFIDFDRFGAGPDLRDDFAPGHPLVGFVGMFRPAKGFESFLDMVKIVHARRPETRFLAVGGDSTVASYSYWKSMRTRAVQLGVGDIVHFTGPRTDIPDIMRSLDVLVVPSLDEGFGRVILEANAVGKPVIGACVGGIPEVIEDEVTGILVPPRDPHAMAAAVVRALDDSDWRARVAAIAPRSVRQRFSPGQQVRRLETIWERAAGAAREAADA